MSKLANDIAHLILAQFRQDEAGRKTQDQIDRAMAGAISDVRRGNPNQLNPPVVVKPIDAVPVVNADEVGKPKPGWADEVPLRTYGTSHADRVAMAGIDKAYGPVNGPTK